MFGRVTEVVRERWEGHWSGSGEERKSQRGQTRHRPLMSLLWFEFLYCHLAGLSIVLGNNEAARCMYGCVFIESIANINQSINSLLLKCSLTIEMVSEHLITSVHHTFFNLEKKIILFF